MPTSLPGTPLSKSSSLTQPTAARFHWITLDRNDLTIAELAPGRRLHEESTMLSMRQLRHERSLAPGGDAKTVVRDRITIQLRLPSRSLTPVIAAGLHALCGHRHRRHQRHFADRVSTHDRRAAVRAGLQRGWRESRSAPPTTLDASERVRSGGCSFPDARSVPTAGVEGISRGDVQFADSRSGGSDCDANIQAASLHGRDQVRAAIRDRGAGVGCRHRNHHSSQRGDEVVAGGEHLFDMKDEGTPC